MRRIEDGYIIAMSAIGILLAFKTHDYLGIGSEMLVLLVFGLLSFTIWFILTFVAGITGNDKRVFYFLGFALMSSGFCIISIYFPFFCHGMYERIKNFKRDPSHSPHRQLLKIFANKKHFDEFRQFSVDALSSENIDFIVAISQWRYEVLQALKEPGFFCFFFLVYNCFIFLKMFFLT